MYTSIARNAVGGEVFHSNATAYPSQAEITLNRYSTERAKGTDGYNSYATNKLSTSLGQNSSCFRCSGPYLWMHDKVILCPHKDHAGVCEAATKNYSKWLAKYKARRKKCNGIDYDCLSSANKEKIKKQVLSSMANSLMKDAAASTIIDNHSNASTPRPRTPNLLIFVVDTSVLFNHDCKQGTSPGTHHDQLPPHLI